MPKGNEDQPKGLATPDELVDILGETINNPAELQAVALWRIANALEDKYRDE